MVDRASGVTGQVSPVPSRSLGSTYSRDFTVRPGQSNVGVREPRGYEPGRVIVDYPDRTIVRGGTRVEPELRLPEDYRGNRYYRAYPRVIVDPPTVIDREVVRRDVRREIDDYGIGDTIGVDRLYETRQRDLRVGPSDIHVRDRRDDDRTRRYTTRGYRLEETERSRTPLSAERIAIPQHGNRMRFYGSDGRVHLVDPGNLEPVWREGWRPQRY